MENTGRITLAIKAKFSNKINKIINPTPAKNKAAWRVLKEAKALSVDQKAAMLDLILEEHYRSSHELQSFFYERREKKIVNKKREEKIASGQRKRKVKTSKAEWEAHLNRTDEDFRNAFKNGEVTV